MRPTRIVCLAVLVGATVIAAATVEPARGQEGLRVVQEQERVEGNRFVVPGMVVNDGVRDALDVSVTVEALDGAKKVVASGVTYVSPAIPPRGSAPFSAKVPKVPNASTFRVTISSYRFGLKSESP